MSLSSEKRKQVLKKVKELRDSTTKPDESLGAELEAELAGLYPTLPMSWLTKSTLLQGTVSIGFLYNYGVSMYVYVDSDDKWLWAIKSTTEGAVRWNVYQDSVGNLVLSATVAGAKMYFNWRAVTGACKLYDSYDKLTAKDWARKQFRIFNPDNEEYIGTWSTSDKELYNRQNISFKEFGFEFFDKDSFTEDDYLIFDAYLKAS
ncbi:MAG: hypothetical protein V3W18_00070 [candidate division Zixibacteria bacterium]